MAPIKKRAIQRAKAKKRKGFFGRRPQDVPIESMESEEISTEPIPSTSTPTINAKSLGTLTVFFDLAGERSPLPLKTMLIYTGFVHSK